MIVPMLKYTFLVYHAEYNSFLEKLQGLGVLHVVKKVQDISKKIKAKYAEINEYEKVIRLLKNRDCPTSQVKSQQRGEETIAHTNIITHELQELQSQLDEAQKEHKKARLWGNFSPEIIAKLKTANIHLRLFTASKKKFLHIKNMGIPVELITETGKQTLFAFIQMGENIVEPDAQEIKFPTKPYPELGKDIHEMETKIETLNICLDEYASNSLDTLESYKQDLIHSLQFDEVVMNTSNKADKKLMVLEGWVPKSKNILLKQYLLKSNVLFIERKATPKDKIPVLLKNNRYSKLFEPIGSMFSLPAYSELDLTVFFAPFFMLFFGFCLGDAGYGLLFVIGAGVYKFKAPKEIKPYLSLIQLLGLATILFGAVSGTFFGINLIETDFSLTANFRNLFLNPDKMFQLSLILGGIQIIFGLFIRAVNQTKQFGFQYALSTCGWLIILLGSIVYAFLSSNGTIPKNNAIFYVILASGGFFVLFFSDPSINVFARVGKGVWDVYSTVTGIFGDLLSYIRLFALGLSSAILGFVINDIGLQILGSSKIIGPVFFVVFLILGHTLNILISSLGSFVHPMRLTFVEFYKSAGFTGGGEEYKPFKK